MTHACGCRHGSSRNSGDSLAPVRPGETVGTVLAALNEGRKAPA